jgi:hypothetical protein
MEFYENVVSNRTPCIAPVVPLRGVVGDASPHGAHAHLSGGLDSRTHNAPGCDDSGSEVAQGTRGDGTCYICDRWLRYNSQLVEADDDQEYRGASCYPNQSGQTSTPQEESYNSPLQPSKRQMVPPERALKRLRISQDGSKSH